MKRKCVIIALLVLMISHVFGEEVRVKDEILGYDRMKSVRRGKLFPRVCGIHSWVNCPRRKNSQGRKVDFFFRLYRNRQYLKRFHFLPKIKDQRTATVNFVGKDSKAISQNLYR